MKGDTVLICGDDSALRQKHKEYFARAVHSVQELDRAFKALAEAFAPRPKNIVLVGGQLRGLDADFNGVERRLFIGNKYFGSMAVNHPDGWYRMFSDFCSDNPNLNVNTRYRVQRAFKPRQMSVLAFRVNNNNNARSLSSHRSPV